MSHILVRDLIGSNISVSMMLGDKLYQELQAKLPMNSKIQIDFTGIDTFATPFFNAAIGRLLKDYSISQLQEKLDFLNITQGGSNVVNRGIAIALEYLAYPNKTKQIAENLSND